MSENAVLSVLKSDVDPKQEVQAALVNAALETGGMDNFTVADADLATG